ncbi:hypothetical protein [Massilia cavernae]|uniref:hypothetical protein n=1 Tax=Massilia cavernae TaxID=2320864 RepID=UPI0011C3880F|nr:hypothetical protein [Massilia cavernae]
MGGLSRSLPPQPALAREGLTVEHPADLDSARRVRSVASHSKVAAIAAASIAAVALLQCARRSPQVA